MLVCTAHEGGGGKLPPFVIFKRKIMTKDDSHLVSSLETTRSAGWMKQWRWTGWNLFGENDQEPTKFTCVGRFPVPQNTQNWAGPEAEGYNASHNSGRNGQHFTATGRQQWQTDGKRWNDWMGDESERIFFPVARKKSLNVTYKLFLSCLCLYQLKINV